MILLNYNLQFYKPSGLHTFSRTTGPILQNVHFIETVRRDILGFRLFFINAYYVYFHGLSLLKTVKTAARGEIEMLSPEPLDLISCIKGKRFPRHS
jgi:hypothetical protein